MPVAIEHYAAFVAATIVLLVIPRPTIIMVITQALSHGRKTALASAAGVGLGDLLTTSLSLAGAGALLAASATLFQIFKFAGAAYLIWIGIKMWRSPVVLPQIDASRDMVKPPSWPVFRDSFLVTALNPKAVLFFVAFVPQFIDPARPYLAQAALYVGTFTGLAIVNAALFALAASSARQAVRRPGVLRIATRMGGTLMMTAGVAAALTRRAA